MVTFGGIISREIYFSTECERRFRVSLAMLESERPLAGVLLSEAIRDEAPKPCRSKMRTSASSSAVRVWSPAEWTLSALASTCCSSPARSASRLIGPLARLLYRELLVFDRERRPADEQALSILKEYHTINRQILSLAMQARNADLQLVMPSISYCG